MIVTNASPVFKSMIENTMKEGNTNIIELPDTDPEIFRLVLDYIYGNEIHITPENVEYLYNIAQFFQYDPLRRKCVEKQDSFVTPEVVWHLANRAIEYSDPNLMAVCLNTIIGHSDDDYIHDIKYLKHARENTLRCILKSNYVKWRDPENLFLDILQWAK